jgi:hypothetical protein
MTHIQASAHRPGHGAGCHLPAAASAAPSAGVAQFIVGDVNVRRTDGGTTPLVKGKDIESGQAIVTGASGRAQVRFTDGGLVSLQPNTEFKVANYVDKADPKKTASWSTCCAAACGPSPA